MVFMTTPKYTEDKPVAGKQIYLARPGNWDTHFTIATIVKVHPSGMMDVQIGGCEPMRFLANGKKQGGGYRDYYLDNVTFDERAALLATEQREREAVAAINAVAPESGVNRKWGKDGLQREVARLQELLNAAQAKVDAI